MTQEGPNDGSFFSSDSSGDVAWTSPENAQSEDATEADTGALSSQSSDRLQALSFFSSVPDTATIDGLEFSVKRRMNNDFLFGAIEDLEVQTIQAGSLGGDDKAVVGDWPTSLAYETYGAADDLWGLSWTPASVNSASTGLSISCQETTGNSAEAYIDHIEGTVYYTEGGDAYLPFFWRQPTKPPPQSPHHDRQRRRGAIGRVIVNLLAGDQSPDVFLPIIARRGAESADRGRKKIQQRGGGWRRERLHPHIAGAELPANFTAAHLAASARSIVHRSIGSASRPPFVLLHEVQAKNNMAMWIAATPIQRSALSRRRLATSSSRPPYIFGGVVEPNDMAAWIFQRGAETPRGRGIRPSYVAPPIITLHEAQTANDMAAWLSGARIHRTPDRRVTSSAAARFHLCPMQEWRFDGRGLHRVFNDAEYRFYRGFGSAPAESDAPFAAGGSLPSEPPHSYADGVWYLSASYFNGVIDSGFFPIGPHGETYLRLDLLGGVQTGAPPLGPADWRLEAVAGGVVRIVAFYFDVAALRAGQWSINYTLDGSTPAADVALVSQAIAAGGLSVLVYDLPAQVHGTTVKARLQTRRFDDPTWIYSESSTVKTITADAEGPTVPVGGQQWRGIIVDA